MLFEVVEVFSGGRLLLPGIETGIRSSSPASFDESPVPWSNRALCREERLEGGLRHDSKPVSVSLPPFLSLPPPESLVFLSTTGDQTMYSKPSLRVRHSLPPI